MTRDDTVKLLMAIQALYPNYNPPDKSVSVNVWNAILKDYDYDTVMIALRAYATSSTSPFAPTVGQLIDKMYVIESNDELNEMEAWNLVSLALRNSSYHAAEEFKKLPSAVQRAVGSPNQLRTWGMDENFNESVVSSNFMRAYATEIKREKELKKMPSDIRTMLENKKQNMINKENEDGKVN